MEVTERRNLSARLPLDTGTFPATSPQSSRFVKDSYLHYLHSTYTVQPSDVQTVAGECK